MGIYINQIILTWPTSERYIMNLFPTRTMASSVGILLLHNHTVKVISRLLKSVGQSPKPDKILSVLTVASGKKGNTQEILQWF